MNREYTKRRNVNRAYMKLDVWQRGMELFKLAFQMVGQTRDWKLRAQFIDAVQSVSANVEGYARRSLPEYLQFLYIAKGSLGESLTRAIGLSEAVLISKDDFEAFDQLHYEVENKLLALIGSLEARDDWQTALPTQSTTPIIRRPASNASRATQTSLNPPRQHASS
jgi:four helix bundle protein